MVKSEMGQTLWDGRKWKNETIFMGQREYDTRIKKKKLSLYEPSLSKNLEAMCRSLKEAYTNLKKEVNKLFRRLSSVGNDQPIGGLLLDNPPLLKLYDIFMEMKWDTHKRIKKELPAYSLWC